LPLALGAENIDTRKYYEPPAHRQLAYKQFYNGSQLPNTELLSARSLSLPMWSQMEQEVAWEFVKLCSEFTRIARKIRHILSLNGFQYWRYGLNSWLRNKITVTGLAKMILDGVLINLAILVALSTRLLYIIATNSATEIPYRETLLVLYENL
jgi:hypothetical protein